MVVWPGGPPSRRPTGPCRRRTRSMNFADNVDYPPLLRRPAVFLSGLALLFLALLRADPVHWPVVSAGLTALRVAPDAALTVPVAAGLAALVGANVWIV